MDRTCCFSLWVKTERGSESDPPKSALSVTRRIQRSSPVITRPPTFTCMPLALTPFPTRSWKLWPAVRRWWRQQWAEFLSKLRTSGRGSWSRRVTLNRWLTDSRNSCRIVILDRPWACWPLKSWPSNLTFASKQMPILPGTTSSCMSEPLSAWRGTANVRCPTLEQLLPPPPGKPACPWTEDSPQLPNTRLDGSAWPRVSVTTPSYNQGQFIEETIRSVLLQGYPDLEYIVIDGGSTDETLEIIRRYEPWLTYWVTEPDHGQTHAINKGWMRATGEILAYINTDDCYLDRTITTAAHEFCATSNVGMVYGSAIVVDEAGNQLRTWEARPFDVKTMLTAGNIVPQPAAFFSRDALKKV